jgi:hypothetical protein
MKSLTLSLALLLFAVPCHGFFCDGGVVAEGDTQIEVLKRCGPPTFRTEPDRLYIHREGSVRQTNVIQWIYNPGPRQFIRTITFVGGYVTDIEEGDYGY